MTGYWAKWLSFEVERSSEIKISGRLDPFMSDQVIALERETPSLQAEYQPSHLNLPERIPELDGLRGFAAIAVVFHHLAQRFLVNHGKEMSHGLYAVWLKLTYQGYLGVDIFFALSGFLITRILINTRTAPHYYRNFYARRVLRLAPPYLIILVLVAFLVPHSHIFLLLSLFYLANFAHLFGVKLMYGPLWSLSVEEHFYLMWPWLIRFLRRRVFFVIAVAVVILTPILRYFSFEHGMFYPFYSWFRFDGLLWGALLAILVTSPRTTRRQIRIWSTVVGLTGLLCFLVGLPLKLMGENTGIGAALSFALVAMATSGFIGHAMLGTCKRAFAVFRHPVSRFLGDISYWVYLIHYLLLGMFVSLFRSWGKGPLAYLVVAALLLSSSILSGVLVRKYVEKPAHALKARFRSRPATESKSA